MPSSIVKSFADKSGKSISEVEKLWNDAKAAITKQYNLTTSDDKFYPAVTGLLKKMLKIEEDGQAVADNSSPPSQNTDIAKVSIQYKDLDMSPANPMRPIQKRKIFESFYDFNTYQIFKENSLITEVKLDESISRDELLSNTDIGRIERSNIEIKKHKSPEVSDEDNGLEKIEYNVKSNNSTTGDRHYGYVIYDPKTKDLSELWCDCQDYFFRLWAPLVSQDLAKWDLPEKYTKRLVTDPNKAWTKETNPDGKIFLCKHLHTIVKDYI